MAMLNLRIIETWLNEIWKQLEHCLTNYLHTTTFFFIFKNFTEEDASSIYSNG